MLNKTKLTAICRRIGVLLAALAILTIFMRKILNIFNFLLIRRSMKIFSSTTLRSWMQGHQQNTTKIFFLTNDEIITG